MDMNDIMGDPIHWKGNYEGRFRSSGSAPGRASEDHFEGFFNGNRAVPYYTSNGNFAGGIIVIMVLVGVLQFSRVQNNAQKALQKRRVTHEQASLNLKGARVNAKTSGRRDMIEAFRHRRDIKPEMHRDDDIERFGITTGKR
jgi:hypothetical protein